MLYLGRARFWVWAGLGMRPGANGVESWVEIGQESVARVEVLVVPVLQPVLPWWGTLTVCMGRGFSTASMGRRPLTVSMGRVFFTASMGRRPLATRYGMRASRTRGDRKTRMARRMGAPTYRLLLTRAKGSSVRWGIEFTLNRDVSTGRR